MFTPADKLEDAWSLVQEYITDTKAGNGDYIYRNSNYRNINSIPIRTLLYGLVYISAPKRKCLVHWRSLRCSKRGERLQVEADQLQSTF